MSVFDVVSNSRDRAAMNFSRLLISVIKTSRSHRCHAMEIVIRFNGIPIRDFASGLIRFPGRTGRSFVIRRGLQRIWEDLRHRDADRLLSKREDRRAGPPRSPIRICVDLQISVWRKKKQRLVLATFSLQSQYLVACRMDFCRCGESDRAFPAEIHSWRRDY